MGSLPSGDFGVVQLLPLGILLAIALAFEFVNGFHDTANAVVTVIYTRSLSPRRAVVWSGICNFVGVHLGGTAVAFSIVQLLPAELLARIDTGPGMAMLLSVLLAALGWNLGTWYLGLPASSSHALVGSVLGVGLANSLIQGRGFVDGVNWGKASEVGAALLISPVVGFCMGGVLLLVLRQLATNPDLYRAPSGDEAPPRWVRFVLLGTCTGVSVAHGSNDGQKGIGLIMLILIGLAPMSYALNPELSDARVERTIRRTRSLDELYRARLTEPNAMDSHLPELLADLRAMCGQALHRAGLDRGGRKEVRLELLRIDRELGRIEEGMVLSDPARGLIGECRAGCREVTNFAPRWVIVAVALALGLGTMVGWKRIVVTVGEKIGKAHMTYSQGATAEVVAMVTIGLADRGGLPVSTTHILSSALAGTMAAERVGLQQRTVRAILTAWVLTLPAVMALSGGLFAVLRRFAF
jgi:PiT family inorganic phosphate transporter